VTKSYDNANAISAAVGSGPGQVVTIHLSFGYRGSKRPFDRDDIITHYTNSTRTVRPSN